MQQQGDITQLADIHYYLRLRILHLTIAENLMM